MSRILRRRVLHAITLLFLLSLLAPLMPAATADTGTPEPVAEIPAAPTEAPPAPEPTVIPTEPPPAPEPTAIPTDPPLPPEPTAGPPLPTATTAPNLVPTEAPPPTDAPTVPPTAQPVVLPTETPAPPTEASTETVTDPEPAGPTAPTPTPPPAARTVQEIEASSETVLLTLTVVVRDATDASTVSGATVRVFDASSNEVASGTADGSGTFATGLTDGTYSVQVSASGYRATGATIALSADLMHSFDLIPVEHGRISVTVTDADSGMPLENANVAIRSLSTGQLDPPVVTDVLGTAESEPLAAGDYTVLITRSDYVSVVRQVMVDGNQFLPVEMVLAPTGSATLLIVDALTDAPIEGAQVTITAHPLAGDPFTAVDTVTVATGAVVIPDIADHDYQFEISHPDYEAFELWSYIQVGAPLTVALQPTKTSVTVTVTDSGSAPIAGATVTITNQVTEEILTGTTGDDGTFSTDALPPNAGLWIEVTASGFVSERDLYFLDQSLDVTFVLTAAVPGTITFTVLSDTDGTPIDGASIRLYDLDWQIDDIYLTTNASGIATVPTDIPGGEYGYSATADGFRTKDGTVMVSGIVEHTIDLTPLQSGTITLTVYAGEWIVIPGATVGVSRYDADSGTYIPDPTLSGSTNAEGVFTSAQVEPGSYRLAVGAPGHFPQDLDITVDGNWESSIYLWTNTPGTITITLSDALSSALVEGATVVVRKWDDTVADYVAVETMTEIMAGTYVSSLMDEGLYEISASRDGYFDLATGIGVKGSVSDAYAMAPLTDGSLMVTVTDNADVPAPIAGATVRISYRDAFDNQVDVTEGVTNDSGLWQSAQALPARDYFAEITHPDYHPWGVSFRVSGNVTLDISLAPRVFGTLSLRITDEQSVPINGATVQILDEWYQPVVSGTAPDGTFTQVLEEGWYIIHVEAAGHLPMGNLSVEVFGETNLGITLARLVDTALTVTVSGSGASQPVPGASVEIRTWDPETGAGEQVVAGGPTDASGNYVSPILEAGQYQVQVSATGYGTVSSSMWVSGEQNAISFELYPERPGILTVTVEDEAQAPIDGASVVAFGSGGGTPIPLVPTGVPGEYRTPDSMAYGDYAVEVSAPGYFTQSMWIWINDDTDIPVTLQARVAGTLSISVVSMDDPSVTIPGATIVISDSDTSTEVATLTTDGNGAASTNLAGADYILNVSATGYTASFIHVRVAGDTPLQVALDPIVPGALTVRVIAEGTETAVAGAQVTVRNMNGEVVASGTTGNDGVYTTDTLPGGGYFADASAPGFFTGSTHTTVKGDTQALVPLAPRVAGNLTVTVEDPNGTPIEGAALEISGEGIWFTGFTGTDGVFTTDTPLQGGTYSVSPTADGYFAGATEYVFITGDQSLTLVLEPKAPGVLTIIVRDSASNDPIAGVDVTVWSQDLQQEFPYTTGIDGTVTTDELPGGFYDLRFDHPGYFHSSIWPYRLSGDATIGHTLDPRVPGTWTLTVLDAVTNEPIPDATVTVSGNNAYQELTADANGVVVVDLQGDWYDARISADGYYEQYMWFQVSGDREDTVSLAPRIGGEVTLTVTDAVTGDAIAGARVILTGNDIADGAYGFTDTSGIFAAGSLQGGYYALSITADGYLPQSDAILVEGDLTRDYALQPRIPGTVTMTVTDIMTQQPIAGATVEVRGMMGSGIVDTGTTDAQGVFTSAELPGDTYYAIVSAPGYVSAISMEFIVNGAVSGDLSLTPLTSPPDTTPVIEVTDADNGDPVAGAQVTLEPYSEGATISGFTGDDGVFQSFGPIPATGYRLTIVADGFITYRSNVELGEAASFVVTLTRSATVPVTITVVASDDERAIAGAVVTTRPMDPFTGEYIGDLVTGTTDINGIYSLPAAPWGVVYHVTVEAAGYRFENENVPLSGDAGPAPVTETIFLEPLPGGTYIVRAIDRYTYDPVVGGAVSVWIGEATGAPDITGTTGGDGTFDTGERLDPARVTVRVEASGYFTATLPGYYGDIRMEPVYQPRQIAITLVDSETDAPIAGAEVRLYECLDTTCDPIVGMGTSDANGQVVFTDLRPGTYQAEVYADGYPSLRRAYRASETRISTHNADAAVTFQMTPLVVQQQTDVTFVLDEQVDGTWTLANANDGAFSRTGTIANGAGVVGLVPHGSGYVLTVNATGYEPVMRTFSATTATMRLEVPLGDLAVPTPTPTAEAPTPTAEVPTPTATTEAPTPTATTEAPTPTATTEVPTPTATTEAPTPTATTEVPTPTATTEAPTPTATTDAPTPTATTPAGEPTATAEPSPTATATSAAPTPTTAAPTATSPAGEPTATATAEPSPTATPTEPDEAPLETSFTLCSNPECEPPHNTGADGFTASWNVSDTGEGTSAEVLLALAEPGADSVALAQAGPARSGLPSALQEAPRTWVITATIIGGVATGFSEPLPEGAYSVCLDPVLRRADGATIQLLEAPACDTVRHDPDAVLNPGDPGSPTAPEVPAFSVVLTGAPVVIPPPDEPGEPGRPAPGQPGTPPDPAPAQPGGPPTGGEPPQAPAKPITSRPDKRAQVTGLPSTGAATNHPASTAPLVLVVAAAVILAGAGIGLRNRWQR